MSDFSTSRYYIQVKYSTGWETIERPSPFDAASAFYNARRRWRSLQVRLLQDGKRIRSDEHARRSVTVALYGRSK